MTRAINRNALRNLRWCGTIEGISTIVLFFVAMPLKYWAGMPMAVSVVGPIHGVLFVLLVWLNLTAIGRVPISKGLALGGILGALLPGGPFVVDRWLRAIGEQTAEG